MEKQVGRGYRFLKETLNPNKIDAIGCGIFLGILWYLTHYPFSYSINQSLEITPKPNVIPSPTLDVVANCSNSEDRYSTTLGRHIDVNISGENIDTGENGVWMTVEDMISGQRIIIGYIGNRNNARFSGASLHGIANSIRGQASLPFVSRKIYQAAVWEASSYTEQMPILKKKIAEKPFSTPDCR